MSENVQSLRVTRRRALGIGGGALLAGAPLLAGVPAGAATRPEMSSRSPKILDVQDLPVAEIQAILRAQGVVDQGVLNVTINRSDLDHVVNSAGIPIKPSFMVNGNVVFQSLGKGRAIMNGDLPFLANEIDHAIDRMLAHGIVFQAEHQHLFNWTPMVWFMHFRAVGNPLALARGVAAILAETATPLPQTMPSKPTTPLDASRLSKILGAAPTISDNGVVSFEIPRREQLILGGIPISPYLNTYTSVAFEPLGSSSDVIADFGMLGSEIQSVMQVLRKRSWLIGCLYNQETEEQPQLFFSHVEKLGDPYELATEVRIALGKTNVKLG